MKNRFPIIALTALLISGCASYGITEAGGRTTIEVENTGWYLFNVLPIASGDPDFPNGNSCRMFEDTANLKNNMKILENAMMNCGAYKAENIVTHTFDEKVLLILLKRYAVHTSAELTK